MSSSIDVADLESIRDSVRSFVHRVLYPLEAEYTGSPLKGAELAAVQAKAKSAGIWLIDAPEELGGVGLGLLGQCYAWEELYQAAVVPPRFHGILGPQYGPLLYHTEGWQRQEYLIPVLQGQKKGAFAQTEPYAGSDPGNMRTRAVRGSDGGWVLNGVKQFITGADEADFFQVVAVTAPKTASSAARMTVFLVDRKSPGLSLPRYDETLDGERVWEVVFDDVHVEDRQVLGQVDGGFGLAQEWIVQGRIEQAARGLAYAKRAIALAVRHASSRQTFGKPLLQHQAIAFMLADSHMELNAAQLVVHDCARRADAGEDVRYLAAAAKITAVETSCRVLDRAIQIHGGMGLMREFPLSRWYWDMRGRRITEGATEVLRMYIARSLESVYGTPA